MSEKQGFMDRLVPAFEEHGFQRTLSKGDYLIREGEVEKHLYLVTEGALRVIYVTGHEEHIIRFGYKGTVFNSLDSFLKGKAVIEFPTFHIFTMDLPSRNVIE
jgi:CRP-like cAMP-binding protein